MKKVVEGLVIDSETGEILNEVEDVEVVIENELPDIYIEGGTRIKTNIKQMEMELKKYLEKFNIEVSADTEKEARKIATKLNKLSTDINSKRLAVAREIKKPADDLKSAVDRLISIIQEKRADILEKADKFKADRFEMIKTLLEIELEKQYNAKGVDTEYRDGDVSPFVKEDSFGKVELSKKGLERMEALANKCLVTQNKVKIRMLELPLKCERLEIPLEYIDVLSFIKDDEVEYSEKLEMLIQNTLRKEDSIKRKLAEKEEKKLQEEEHKIRMEKKEKELLAERTGKKIVKINAVFEVEINMSIDDMEVLNTYKWKLAREFKRTFKTISLC